MKTEKRLFLDSDYGSDNIRHDKDKFPDDEYIKINKVIEYEIERLLNNEIFFEEWESMYNLLYSFIPWQLFIEKLDEFASLLACIVVSFDDIFEKDKYNKMYRKLYSDLEYSNIFDNSKTNAKKL